MATKEDILEQIVEEYLSHKGYFVRHNIKFKPRDTHPDFQLKKDSNHSDIDVLAVNPQLKGPKRVYAVSCKSWQSGFDPTWWIDAIIKNKRISGRRAWQYFRELCVPKWSEAFLKSINDETGADHFTCVLAVSYVRGDKSVWENNMNFKKALGGNPIRIITFAEMVSDINSQLKRTLAGTEVGRMLQMFRAAGLTIGLEKPTLARQKARR